MLIKAIYYCAHMCSKWPASALTTPGGNDTLNAIGSNAVVMTKITTINYQVFTL